MKGGFAVFDFSEVDVVVFDTDNVDFVEVGFVVLFNDGVAVLLKVISDERFSLFADGGGVFVGCLL